MHVRLEKSGSFQEKLTPVASHSATSLISVVVF